MDARKDQFEQLLVAQRHAIIAAHQAWTGLLEARVDLERTPEWAANGPRCHKNNMEAEYTHREHAVSEITAKLWAMVSCPTPPAPINTVPGLLATVDEYAQAHVALSQTRTPHTRAKASQRAETLRLAIKMAVEG